MKKRIITSMMTSVMALSGAASALVASAADLDYEDYKSQTVTKAELRAFMDTKTIKDLVDGGIDDYGSVSGENFQKAVDYANAVLEDVGAGDEEVVVAYQMVKAAKAALKQHTKEELQILVAECKPTYDKDNVLNEDDAIYPEDLWGEFADAFDTADDCKDSDDILDTTDAWDALDSAYKALEPLDTVTKREIESARSAYIKALEREFDYQPWQRGTVSDSGTGYDGKKFAWGALYAHVATGKDALMNTYEDFTKIKGRTITSNPTIVKAVSTMKKAAKVLDGFDSKFDSASTKKPVTDLLKKYHGQLVYTYNQDQALAVASSFTKAVADADGEAKFSVGDATKTYSIAKTFTAGSGAFDDNGFWLVDTSAPTDYKPLGKDKSATAVTKLIGAKIEVKTTEKVWFVVKTDQQLENNEYAIVDMDGNGKYFDDEDGVNTYMNGKTNLAKKSINANTTYDLAKYIPVTPDDVHENLVQFVDAKDVNADSTVSTALASVMTAISTTVLGGISAFLGSVTDAVAQASSLVVGTSTGNVAQENKTAVVNAIASVQDAATAIKDLTSTSTDTLAEFKDLKGKISALDELVDAVINACPTQDTLTTPQALGTLIEDIQNLTTAYSVLATAVSGSAFNSLVDTYEDEFNNVALGMVDEIDFSANNEYFDKSGEVLNKKELSFTPSSGTDAFNLASTYGDMRSDNGIDFTTVSIDKAMLLYKDFTDTNIDQTGAYGLDNIEDLPTGMVEDKNYSKAWKLLYNYMKYALEDQFVASAEKTHTWRDVRDLKEDAEELINKTIDTQLFYVSHNALVDNVNAASEWLKVRAKDRSYEDYITAYPVDIAAVGGNVSAGTEQNSTQMYNTLKDTYDQLNDEYKGFAYSYEEISKKMADIAKEIDDGKFSEDVAKELTKALQDTADRFLKVEAVEDDDNNELPDSDLFNDDGTMNMANRLYTSTSDIKLYTDKNVDAEIAKAKDSNKTHYNMLEKYKELCDLYTKATAEPEDKVTTDVDGNGVELELADVQKMLQLFVDNKGEVAKHDFDGDGKITIDDVSKLLNMYVNKKD